jgi:DNA-binding transcriptional ArsR family regulator
MRERTPDRRQFQISLGRSDEGDGGTRKFHCPKLLIYPLVEVLWKGLAFCPCCGQLNGGGVEVTQDRRKVRRRGQRRCDLSVPESLAKALSHPIRVKALAVFADRISSPKELAVVLDLPISNVSYHVRVLVELGLIELREEERVRGSLAHFYGLNEQSGVDEKVINTLLTLFSLEE